MTITQALNIRPGDEIQIDAGEPELAAPIIVATIEYRDNDTFHIVDTDGEWHDCMSGEIT